MAYYDKETSDELKDKFKDLAKPTGADFSGLVGYFDKGLQGMDVVASTNFKGDKGDDGLSAYQVAVINGYKGSQTDWLASLVGAKGDKGDKGDTGKDFQIVKTFPSIAKMNGDGFSDGDFTMIASDVNDPDDGKLYVWNGTGFTYIADLSGSQGMKGDTGNTGDKGDKGDTGDQGLSAYQVAVNAGFSGSVNQWLASLVGAKGDKGDKGDTGTVDNAGLISAPAFQSLQTQVDNSAVGTNLLLGTGNNLIVTGTNVLNQITNDYLLANGYNISALASALGTQFTISFDWLVSGSSISGAFSDTWNNSPWAGGIDVLTEVSSSNTSGHISNTFNLSTYSKSIATGVHFRLDNFVGTLTISNVKLEKGSVATDWCPNPSEILTQSDYSKIKAAIVALGGSLS